jgi:hypothetical protein
MFATFLSSYLRTELEVVSVPLPE